MPALQSDEHHPAETTRMYALILAGGKGERLRPLTDDLPKPMVPVGGHPILAHQVEWLKSAGVTDVVFLAGYLWEKIQEYFGDGGKWGIKAHYSIEESPLGRGGAVRQGLSRAPSGEEMVLVLNGDVITEEPAKSIVTLHRQARRANPDHLATIMVVPMISPYGIVDLDDRDQVMGFREKVEIPYWINAGVYALDPRIAPEFPELGDHETETFPRLAQAGQVWALKSRAFWRSVDSFKDLREAEDHLRLH